MKKIAIAIFVVGLLSACGNNGNVETTAVDSTAVDTTEVLSPEVVDTTAVDTTAAQ
jgi:hypothetical protein